MKSMFQNVATWAGEIAAFILTIAGVLKVWPGIVSKAKAGLRKASPLTNIFDALNDIREDMKTGFDRTDRGLTNVIQGRRVIMGTDEVKAWLEMDPEGTVIWTSRLWSVFTGLQPDELRGHGWESSVLETERGTVMASWEAAFEHQRAFESVVTLVDRAGHKTRARLIAWPIRDNDGRGVVLSYLGHATREP